VLKEIAGQVGAEFEVVPMIPETPLGLAGRHQRINASLAVGLAKKFLATRGQEYDDDLPESFKKPLADTRWPGRCQVVPQGETTWYLDGAHTTESLTCCGQWAWSTGHPNVLVFNCSGGRAGESLLGSLLDAGAKELGVSLEELGKSFDTVIFCTNVTYVDGNFKGDLTSKAIDPDDLSALATQRALRDAWIRLIPSFNPDRVHAVGSIEHAVNIVRELGKKEVLVAGSLHLVGGVMEVAGLQFALGMD